MIAKRALAEAGLAPSHVSADNHGMSQTAFGIAVLNGLHTRVENRYLTERLMFQRDAGADVMRRIVRVLKAGGVVTMTNNCYAGLGFVELPLGRHGWVNMATAALSLAVRHDVPLFSMAAIETEPCARYLIELGPEIGPEIGSDIGPKNETASQGAARSDHDRIAAAAASVRDTLLERLRRWPDQYPASAPTTIPPRGFRGCGTRPRARIAPHKRARERGDRGFRLSDSATGARVTEGTVFQGRQD